MTTSRIPVVAALAMAVLGCGGSQGGGSGRVTVLLKDAPAEFRAAVVTIEEVDLVGSSGTVVLTTTPTTTDLLTLSNDVATLVQGAVVPAGTYTQLRFVISGGYVDVAGAIYASSPTYAGLPAGASVAGELRMPSYARSGLKVILPGEGLTVASDTSVLVVDFDVSQSFGHEAGGSGAWVMHPVVKASPVEQTGSLAVTLGWGVEVSAPADLALSQFQAVLAPAAGGDATTVALADAGDGTATATFVYLAPGDYTLTLQPPASVSTFTTDPVVPATVTVAAGQVTPASFRLLSAVAAP